MRGYSCIGLWQPKDSINIGSVLRAAACFGTSFVAVEGKRYSRASTDTCKQWRHAPLIEVDALQSIIPFQCVPIAIEVPFLTAKASELSTNRQTLGKDFRCLSGFTHPERAFYIFGGEDRSLSVEIMKWCRDCVFIPSDQCLNLAAAVNVVLYDRSAKSSRK